MLSFLTNDLFDFLKVLLVFLLLSNVCNHTARKRYFLHVGYVIVYWLVILIHIKLFSYMILNFLVFLSFILVLIEFLFSYIFLSISFNCSTIIIFVIVFLNIFNKVVRYWSLYLISFSVWASGTI